MLPLFVWQTLPKELETQLPRDIRLVAQRVSKVPTDKIGLILTQPEQVPLLGQAYHAAHVEKPRFIVLLTTDTSFNTRGWCACTFAHLSGFITMGAWQSLRTMLCPLQRTLSFSRLIATGGLTAFPEKPHAVTLADFPNLPQRERKHLESCETCVGIFLDNAQHYLFEKLEEAMIQVGTQYAQKRLEEAIASGELSLPGMSPIRPRGRA